MNVKKFMWWVVFAFVIWWVVKQPHAAAQVARHLGSVATQAASGLGTFASSL